MVVIQSYDNDMWNEAEKATKTIKTDKLMMQKLKPPAFDFAINNRNRFIIQTYLIVIDAIRAFVMDLLMWHTPTKHKRFIKPDKTAVIRWETPVLNHRNNQSIQPFNATATRSRTILHPHCINTTKSTHFCD